MCEKKFKTGFELKSHKKCHTDLRPFQCYECGKKFKDSRQLKTHEMIHNGKKPYSCSKCNKKFSQSANLSRHEKHCHIVQGASVFAAALQMEKIPNHSL